MSDAATLLHRAPQELVSFLRDQHIRRFHFVRDPASGRVESSHPVLQPIADFLGADPRDFRAHEGLFFQVTERHDTLQGAFVHRTRRGQAAGGVRYWRYDDLESYLRDGLRLAMGMTHKNALAGLWWGGGKGVMAHNPAVELHDPEVRASIYREYGELLTAIRGCYVTAEDVGTSVEDMGHVYSATRFTTCISPHLGGSGNPSVPTARGVVSGMEAALAFLGWGELEGKTIAVQGMGHVGEPLLRFLLEKKVAKVYACDIDPALVDAVSSAIGSDRLEARAGARDDRWIFGVDCDVFAPCATGAILNPTTIAELGADVVCGAANNQLEDPERDGRLLHERGIVYVPDFLTNRMGIVNCADEQSGHVTPDPAFERHLDREWEHSIHNTALRVLRESARAGVPPPQVALQLAEEMSMELHPLLGHRGQRIIDALAAERWWV